jgi:hypothetical protein
VLAKQVLDYLLSDPTAIPQANRANQARENPRIAVARGARGVRGALQDHPRVEGLLRGLQIMLAKAHACSSAGSPLVDGVQLAALLDVS